MSTEPESQKPETPEVPKDEKDESEGTRKMDPEIKAIAQAIRVIEPLSDAAKTYIVGRYTRLKP